MKPGSDSDGDVRVAHVLYPFGYGLSYTDFKYSDMKLSSDTIPADGTVTVSVDVFSSVITYEKVLRGFERISLEPGETRRVEFRLDPSAFALLDLENRLTVEPGTFTLMAGSSSADIRTTCKLEIKD